MQTFLLTFSNAPRQMEFHNAACHCKSAVRHTCARESELQAFHVRSIITCSRQISRLNSHATYSFIELKHDIEWSMDKYSLQHFLGTTSYGRESKMLMSLESPNDN